MAARREGDAHAQSGSANSNRARESVRGKGGKKMGPAGILPMEELSELSQELLRELSSGYNEEILRRGLEIREKMENQLLDRQAKAQGIAEALAEAEARMFQNLQHVQTDVQQLRGRSRELDMELDKAQQTWRSSKDKTQAMRGELEELQEKLRELREEKEDGDDPNLPPDVYMAQLYYEISRIDWDYSAEPGRIRGIHHGPEIAVPLDLDETQHSGIFISDYLWGLLPTEWRPRRPPLPPREPPSP